MKELSLALILVLLVGSFAQAVPYPYRGYTIPDGDAEVVEDAIKEAHTVSAGAESGRFYPWSELSFAVLESPELIEAEINCRAEFQFWSDAEKEKKLAEGLRALENKVHVSLALIADRDVDGGYRYTNTTGPLSFIDRIILETSDGRRLEPANTLGGDSDVVAGYWMSVTLLSFPRYVDGVQIIDESTEWIRLWVISGSSRIYFQFDFD